jgi:2-haloacid dehalogenase
VAGWITLDCYGTLVDWRHGIRSAAELVAPGHGDALLAAYHRHEPAVEAAEPAARYRTVLATTFRRAASDTGVDLPSEQWDVLSATLPYWPVFADVGPALAQLSAAGWRLGVLTNCDRDLFALTRRRLPGQFDLVVTAEDVGAYKPAPAHFQRFAEIVGWPTTRWIHVAQSRAHDIEPTAMLSIPSIWVNRLAEDGAHVPASAIVTSLTDLPAAVARLAESLPR